MEQFSDRLLLNGKTTVVRNGFQPERQIQTGIGPVTDRIPKGCLSHDGMLHMTFKLSEYAEKIWRRLKGFNFLTKVITGMKFKDGIEMTKETQIAD